jgi:hypothetical protein
MAHIIPVDKHPLAKSSAIEDKERSEGRSPPDGLGIDADIRLADFKSAIFSFGKDPSRSWSPALSAKRFAAILTSDNVSVSVTSDTSYE